MDIGDDNRDKEYHEEIKDPKEIQALEQLKNSLATITNENDKAVLDFFVLLNNDFLINFLRFRKLNVKATTKAIINYFHWKKKMNVDDIYSNYQLKEKYKFQLILPHGFHKITKDGYPIFFQNMINFNSDELFKLGTGEEIIRYIIKIMETGIRDVLPICRKIKGSYIYGIFIILDCKGLNNSALKLKFLNLIRDYSQLADYYPELLISLYVINAGLVFRSFYSAIKIFLIEKVKKKFRVYGENFKDGLLEKIAPENLPKFYGGSCECPEGCLFSNAGPWKNTEETEEVPEDILKKRKELNELMESGEAKKNKV